MTIEQRRNAFRISGHAGGLKVDLTIEVPDFMVPQEDLTEQVFYDTTNVRAVLDALRGVPQRHWAVTNDEEIEQRGMVVPYFERGRSITAHEAVLRHDAVARLIDGPRATAVVLIDVVPNDSEPLSYVLSIVAPGVAHDVMDHCEMCGGPLFHDDRRVCTSDDHLVGIDCCNPPLEEDEAPEAAAPS